MFVAASVTSSNSILCYAAWTDANLSCIKGPGGGASLSLPNAKICHGDGKYASIKGKEVDAKYYWVAFTEAQLEHFFDVRKIACALNCLTCADLVTCSVCKSGYYVETGQCLSCDSRCETCQGPGNTKCLVCAAGCRAAGPNTCIREC